jgi:hypothetical protein
MPQLDASRFDLSQLIEAGSFEELAEIRAGARDASIEGMMLKRRDSPYVAGRRVGLWYKWKRDPLTADCVVMYAQRGSGKRSSYYSDYTFGCWAEDGELLPVGKAYMARPLGAATYDAALRSGPGGREDAGDGGGVRLHPPQQAPPLGPGDALPPDQPHPHRQAGA